MVFIFLRYVKNFRNEVGQSLMISFLVDIIIHCVLKFGLHTAYIYGGHFVFVVPLLIGWLFYYYRNSPKTLSFIYASVWFLFSYLILNNTLRMQEFFDFLNAYYQ